MAEVDDGPEIVGPGLSAPVPLTFEHDLSGFECGVPALNDWLRDRALKNESRFSRTYVVCDGNRVVAYFCISAGSVERAAAPGTLRRILSDALRRVAIASQTIGIAAALVQAKDDSAKRFYMQCAEFIEYPQDSRTLFLPIETVVAAFS